MKQILLVAISLFWSLTTFAQMESSVYSATGRGGVATTFVTDYQCIGINPANLGIEHSFRDPKFTIGLLEVNTTITSEAFSTEQLLDIFSGEVGDFTNEQKKKVGETFANKVWSQNIDIMLFGFHMKLPKGQGVAFNMRDRISYYSKVNETAADLLFNGYNSSYFSHLELSIGGAPIQNPNHYNQTPLSNELGDLVYQGSFDRSDDPNVRPSSYAELLNGSRISASWFREFNLSYGKRLYDSYNFQLSLGVGIKYIQGYAIVDLEAENGVLSRNLMASSPNLHLNLGTQVESSGQVATPMDIAFPDPVGHGYGLDLGISMTIKRNLNIGMALVNYGQILWTANVTEVSNDSLKTFRGTGLNNYNIFATNENTFGFGGTSSAFQYTDVQGTKVDALPTTLRFGASYNLYNTYHFGFDVLIPQNRISGNIDKPHIGLGIDIRLYKLFKFSTGISTSGSQNSKVNLPIGITYIARKGGYEMGVATRDISSFIISDERIGSTLSVAGGFTRFKF